MSAYQVGPQTFITIRYQVFDAEGEAASEPEVHGYVFGMGGLLPEVERALDAHLVGDMVRVQLKEQQAYGARNAKGILEVDRSEFPDDISPGDRFEVENEYGGILVLHVLDVQDDMVVVDTNHPLAGQEVGVAVEVLDVRPATEEEIEAALLCQEDDAAEQGPGLVVDGQAPDVSITDLLRRR